MPQSCGNESGFAPSVADRVDQELPSVTTSVSGRAPPIGGAATGA
jgi:hypothetical protein